MLDFGDDWHTRRQLVNQLACGFQVRCSPHVTDRHKVDAMLQRVPQRLAVLQEQHGRGKRGVFGVMHIKKGGEGHNVMEMRKRSGEQ